MKIKLLLIVPFLSMLSCVSKKQVTAKAQTTEVVAINTEDPGKVLFQKQCASCHDLYAPNAYTAQQWEPIVFEMQKKGGIPNDETYIILDYLKKNAKPQ
jgi:hypothetical protein